MAKPKEMPEDFKKYLQEKYFEIIEIFPYVQNKKLDGNLGVDLVSYNSKKDLSKVLFNQDPDQQNIVHFSNDTTNNMDEQIPRFTPKRLKKKTQNPSFVSFSLRDLEQNVNQKNSHQQSSMNQQSIPISQQVTFLDQNDSDNSIQIQRDQFKKEIEKIVQAIALFGCPPGNEGLYQVFLLYLDKAPRAEAVKTGSYIDKDDINHLTDANVLQALELFYNVLLLNNPSVRKKKNQSAPEGVRSCLKSMARCNYALVIKLVSSVIFFSFIIFDMADPIWTIIRGGYQIPHILLKALDIHVSGWLNGFLGWSVVVLILCTVVTIIKEAMKRGKIFQEHSSILNRMMRSIRKIGLLRSAITVVMISSCMSMIYLYLYSLTRPVRWEALFTEPLTVLAPVFSILGTGAAIIVLIGILYAWSWAYPQSIEREVVVKDSYDIVDLKVKAQKCVVIQVDGKFQKIQYHDKKPPTLFQKISQKVKTNVGALVKKLKNQSLFMKLWWIMVWFFKNILDLCLWISDVLVTGGRRQPIAVAVNVVWLAWFPFWLFTANPSSFNHYYMGPVVLALFSGLSCLVFAFVIDPNKTVEKKIEQEALMSGRIKRFLARFNVQQNQQKNNTELSQVLKTSQNNQEAEKSGSQVLKEKPISLGKELIPHLGWVRAKHFALATTGFAFGFFAIPMFVDWFVVEMSLYFGLSFFIPDVYYVSLGFICGAGSLWRSYSSYQGEINRFIQSQVPLMQERENEDPVHCAEDFIKKHTDFLSLYKQRKIEEANKYGASDLYDLLGKKIQNGLFLKENKDDILLMRVVLYRIMEKESFGMRLIKQTASLIPMLVVQVLVVSIPMMIAYIMKMALYVMSYIIKRIVRLARFFGINIRNNNPLQRAIDFLDQRVIHPLFALATNRCNGYHDGLKTRIAKRCGLTDEQDKSKLSQILDQKVLEGHGIALLWVLVRSFLICLLLWRLIISDLSAISSTSKWFFDWAGPWAEPVLLITLTTLIFMSQILAIVPVIDSAQLYRDCADHLLDESKGMMPSNKEMQHQNQNQSNDQQAVQQESNAMFAFGVYLQSMHNDVFQPKNKT